jgi:hypothetical protein
MGFILFYFGNTFRFFLYSIWWYQLSAVLLMRK